MRNALAATALVLAVAGPAAVVRVARRGQPLRGDAAAS